MYDEKDEEVVVVEKELCECGAELTDEDDSYEIGDEEFDGRRLCRSCKEEELSRRGAFMGDFSEMHPDETDEEFSEHEDWD